jgi:nicotinamidase-related amidase
MTLQLDPSRTALVLIDPQKWTLGMPIAPHAAPDIVERIKPLIRALRPDGFVVWTRAAFSSGYKDMLKAEVDMELKVPVGGLPPELLEFDARLNADEPDLVITKRQWSALYCTELDLQLRRRRIDTLILAGVMTNFGVESTARDGWQNNYAVLVAEDACSSIDAEMDQFAISRVLPRVSRVRSTVAILESLYRGRD